MKLHQRLFLLILTFLPVQVGYHFWLDWTTVFGIRVDYLSPTIYLTDILIFLLIIFWIRSIGLRRVSTFIKKQYLTLLVSLIFIILNIYLALVWQAALYKWLKFIEFVLLGIYVQTNWSELKDKIHLPLFASTLAVFLLALSQLVKQETVGGVMYYLGERTFTAQTPGISLFSFFGRSLMRPYATFPHPNALGAFAAFILIVSFFQKNNFLKNMTIGMALMLASVSFSQAIWLTLLLLTAYWLVSKKFNIRRQVWYLVLVSVFGLSLISPTLANFQVVGNDLDGGINKRLTLNSIALSSFKTSPVFGVGLGNFIPKSVKLYQANNLGTYGGLVWFLQPVHNIYLLVLAELGLIGFIGLFIVLTLAARKNTNSLGEYLMILILVTGLVDHYWLTLQQTQMIFAIVLGIIFSYNPTRHDKVTS